MRCILFLRVVQLWHNILTIRSTDISKQLSKKNLLPEHTDNATHHNGLQSIVSLRVLSRPAIPAGVQTLKAGANETLPDTSSLLSPDLTVSLSAIRRDLLDTPLHLASFPLTDQFIAIRENLLAIAIFQIIFPAAMIDYPINLKLGPSGVPDIVSPHALIDDPIFTIHCTHSIEFTFSETTVVDSTISEGKDACTFFLIIDVRS